MKHLHVNVLIFFILATSGDVEISFMKVAPRLNDPIHCDYFIACHVEGEILQWNVNNNNISKYFNQSEVGQVFSRSISNCNYITTLLLLKPLSIRQSIFGSVLIISCQNDTNFSFDVVCTNGSLSKMTSNPKKELNTISETNISSVILEHVLTERLLTADSFSCINIFVCGTDNSFLTFQTENNVFGLTTFNSVGRHEEMLQDTDTAVESQVILIGKTPYGLVAAMFVINGAGTNVTCGYNNENTASIASMQCPAKFVTTESRISTTESGISTAGVSATTASLDGNNRALIIGLGVFAGVGIIIGIGCTAFFIFCCCFIFCPATERSDSIQPQIVTTAPPLPRRETNERWKESTLPEDYLQLKKYAWYHGRISREEAESFLQDQPLEGTFLIRLSATETGYALSVKLKDSVRHIKVIQENGNYYVTKTKNFNSLNELIDHYKEKGFEFQETTIRLIEISTGVIKVVALYNFDPQEEGDLSFCKGDIIDNVDKSEDPDWWKGTCRGIVGTFPRNYVKESKD